MPASTTVGEALIRECRKHLIENSWPRIRTAVEALGDDDLWRRENASTNSVGNLLLHLSGNVRQWIVSGLGGLPDERERDREFAERGPLTVSEVMGRLERTLEEAAEVLDRLDPEQLLRVRRIQGESVTGVEALVHVAEHFSYHVGQIAHMVKAARDLDLGYYAGRDLNQKNRG